MQGELWQTEIESNITKVEQEIEAVEAQIEAVEAKLEGDLSEKDTDYYRQKEGQLRKEKEQLRKKEEQIREEKEQLREVLSSLKNHVSEQQAPSQLEGVIAAEMQAMRLEIHGVRETLPSVLVGHVITPSQASRIPQVVSSVFDSLGLSLIPPRAAVEPYELPTSCGDEWKFSWKWKSGTNMDDRVLERTSYKPVENFLRGVGLFCVDVSEGQYCVEKLLYNSDVYTRRNQNPLEVRGQQVFLRHRVQGRSDLAVLRADNEGGYILRNMVKFVIEIKTVTGYRQSQTGCMREAQLQLIGLNAFNTNNSPPVVLSNLARVHQVLYLDTDDDWNYSIRVRHCSSFAAAIHFANTLSDRACISYHFSRPKSPDPE